MRRILGILALLALVPGRPADAHSCASPVQVPVGQSATVNIGVAAEAAEVVRVDVSLPKGFRLERVIDIPGWKAERSADKVSFTQGSIAPFGCGLFTLAGVVAKKATLAFPLATHAADGTIQRYESTKDNDQYPAQLVFAGTTPEAPGEDYASTGGLQWVGWTVLGLGVSAAALVFVRRRLGATSPPPPRGRRAAPPGRGRRASGSSRSGKRKPQQRRRK